LTGQSLQSYFSVARIPNLWVSCIKTPRNSFVYPPKLIYSVLERSAREIAEEGAIRISALNRRNSSPKRKLYSPLTTGCVSNSIVNSFAKENILWRRLGGTSGGNEKK